MSERLHDAPTPEGEYFENGRFAGLSTLFAVIAVVGLGLSVVGGFLSPRQFSFSWLFGFAFYFTVFCRLPFLDHRALRDRCGVDRSR